ncbi:FadR/GntR family transcriptional regulator [Actibacterium lipolyticum]|uniref:Putative L-lactate dehydrogenase operon regulatory protein n=1 Tax=Actibacterium lipolyticum TaxID=1524263 RepID=A0A238JMI4_9RHOB|nr:FadR/GntR family transcriptional regulator [Actibacterium lipolyticum]SMX31092.1 Putative L-lactate dehydrogenase operon regulatory protein [Actibacterium lipolyticum]
MTKYGYLAEEIERDLREAIADGTYSPGAKLPTESALGTQYGVSRTVVREAIAGLRASGIVNSRRGSGVFVAPEGAFSGKADGIFVDVPSGKVPEVIDALELRAAVEIEAARLAAQRASQAQILTIHMRQREFEEKLSDEEPLDAEDQAFHEAIAQATNNSSFVEFMRHLGRRTIPRANLSPTHRTEQYQQYMSQLKLEHRAIAEAIEARDVEGAADAMGTHLRGSLARYRELARQIKHKL